MRAHTGLLFAAILSAVAIFPSWGSEPRSQFSIRDRQETDKERKLILDAVGFVSKELKSTANQAAPSEEPRLVRITARPVHIPARRAMACAPSTQKPVGPHADHWIDVYVTRPGSAVITGGNGTYPKGTIILKRKYPDPEGKTTELFTGMLKREKGYNPEVGDWQFFVLDSQGEHVTKFGRLVSCMDCHAAFKKNDFVSRKYAAAVTAR
jgi:hypothetical protein